MAVDSTDLRPGSPAGPERVEPDARPCTCPCRPRSPRGGTPAAARRPRAARAARAPARRRARGGQRRRLEHEEAAVDPLLGPRLLPEADDPVAPRPSSARPRRAAPAARRSPWRARRPPRAGDQRAQVDVGEAVAVGQEEALVAERAAAAACTRPPVGRVLAGVERTRPRARRATAPRRPRGHARRPVAREQHARGAHPARRRARRRARRSASPPISTSGFGRPFSRVPRPPQRTTAVVDAAGPTASAPRRRALDRATRPPTRDRAVVARAARAARSPHPAGSAARARAGRRTGAPPRRSPRPPRSRCRRGNTRARTRPSASSSQAQAADHGVARRGVGERVDRRPASRAAAWRTACSTPAGRGSTSARPRDQVPTSPAGGRRVRTGVPACASSQAVPTSGCPASGSSTAGV